MKNCILLATIVFLSMTGLLHAEDDKGGIPTAAFRSLIETLNGRIDETANSLNAKEANTLNRIHLIQQQVDGLRALETRIRSLEDRIIKDEILRNELQAAITAANYLEEKVTNISTSTTEALSSAKDAQSRASSTGWILTIVSSIVSILVIVIGLFFSSQFTALNAENKVTSALLERIEKNLNNSHSKI